DGTDREAIATPPGWTGGSTAVVTSVTAVAPAPTPAGRAPEAEHPPWTIRRSPVPLAVGAIIVVALGGWALRTWGPVNPAVTIYADSMGSPVTDTVWTISAGVYNEARAPIEVLDVRATPKPGELRTGPT